MGSLAGTHPVLPAAIEYCDLDMTQTRWRWYRWRNDNGLLAMAHH
jgi:hypothetical protein